MSTVRWTKNQEETVSSILCRG